MVALMTAIPLLTSLVTITRGVHLDHVTHVAFVTLLALVTFTLTMPMVDDTHVFATASIMTRTANTTSHFQYCSGDSEH